MRQKKIIAEWLYSVRQKTGISWAELARRANIKAATTLSRAVDMNHTSVMSVKNLEAIAQAAGIPSILDFLLYQSGKPRIQDDKIDKIIALLQENGKEKNLTNQQYELIKDFFEEHSL